MLPLVVQHCCWLFIVRVCHCPSWVSTVWLSCYQWWCGPVLVGSHVAVVLEWCSMLMDSGSHFWFCGFVVCCCWGWQYYWCGQWWLWWKKCYVQTQRWDCLHMMISPGITTCPLQFHQICYGILLSLVEPWTPHRIIRWNQTKWYLTCHWWAMWLKGNIPNIPFVVFHIAWYLLCLNSVLAT